MLLRCGLFVVCCVGGSSSTRWHDFQELGLLEGLRSLEHCPGGTKGVLWGLLSQSWVVRASPALDRFLASWLVMWSPIFVMSFSRHHRLPWDDVGSMPSNLQNCELNRTLIYKWPQVLRYCKGKPTVIHAAYTKWPFAPFFCLKRCLESHSMPWQIYFSCS